MAIRKNARRSLLQFAMTAAVPLGAQAATGPYLNLPTFSCGGAGGTSLQSIDWGDGIALNGPGTPGSYAAPVATLTLPTGLTEAQPFGQCAGTSAGAGWVSTGWVSTGWVSADSFKIDFGVPALPAVQQGWIDLKWAALTSETYKIDTAVTLASVDPTAVEYVTDFNLKLDVYLKDAQTGAETLQGADWVTVQVLSLTDYVSGASLSLDPNSVATGQDLTFDPSLPGGYGEVNLLATPDAAVPEPASLGLGLLGLAAVAGLAARRRATE